MPRPGVRCYFFTLFVLFLLSNQARTQQTSPEGYYVTLKNDTIAGSFPRYRETIHNPASVTFLAKGSTHETELVPDSCFAIVISRSDKFLSYHGKRLLNPTSALDVTGNFPDRYEEVSVFLRELYDNGNFRLYALPGERRDNFYI